MHPGVEFHVARMQANFHQTVTRDTTRSAGLHYNLHVYTIQSQRT